MKSSVLIALASASDIEYSNDKVGKLSLSYTTYFEDIDDIHLTFPYKPMLKGKWEFEDFKSNNEWTPEKSFRICAEIGTEYDSDVFLESIRWYRTGDPQDTWKVQSLKSYSSASAVTMGNFCTKTIDDEAFENEGMSEIQLVGNSTFDVDNRKLSFEFTRPFDVQRDHAMTFIGGYDFKIWTTWTIAASPDAVAEGRNRIY